MPNTVSASLSSNLHNLSSAELKARAFFVDQLNLLTSEANVSRETLADIELYVQELRRWQTVKNLVSASAFSELWQRHLIDGLHLRRADPTALVWMDWGSGAGLPAIVLAILLKSIEGAHVTAVESNGRKCAFLQAMAQKLNLPLTVINKRIEAIANEDISNIDRLTARGLASLPKLITWSTPFLINKNIKKTLFIKGQRWQSEAENLVLPTGFALINRTVFDASTQLIAVE